jgi:hypothetical protein
VLQRYLVLLSLAAAGALQAQTRTFIKEYTHRAGDTDSRLTSKAVATDQVKKAVLEEVGTIITSSTQSDQGTVVVNGQRVSARVYFAQNIASFATGIARLTVLDERWDGKEFWLKAEVVVDTAEARRELQKALDRPPPPAPVRRPRTTNAQAADDTAAAEPADEEEPVVIPQGSEEGPRDPGGYQWIRATFTVQAVVVPAERRGDAAHLREVADFLCNSHRT